MAAGSGTRFGADIPKQYVRIAGRPLLMHTLDALRSALPKAAITLVIGHGQSEMWAQLCQEYDFASPTTVEGGATRWQSVYNGLDTISRDTDIVMVHDGVRPFVTEQIISNLLAGLQKTGAAIPVVPVVDSLRMVDADGKSQAVDRAAYRAVQTPQAFDAALLRKAYSEPYSPLFTDDASVVEAIGGSITLVDGDTTNIKVTNPTDASVAERQLNKTRDNID